MNSLLHKSAYSDPAILATERESIFFRTWQLAGHTSQLNEPGDFVTVWIAG